MKNIKKFAIFFISIFLITFSIILLSPLKESTASDFFSQELLNYESAFYSEISFLYDSGQVEELNKLLEIYSSDNGDIVNELFIRPGSALDKSRYAKVIQSVEAYNCMGNKCGFKTFPIDDQGIINRIDHFKEKTDSSIYFFPELPESYSNNISLGISFEVPNETKVTGEVYFLTNDGKKQKEILESRFIGNSDGSGKIIISYGGAYFDEKNIIGVLVMLDKYTDSDVKLTTLDTRLPFLSRMSRGIEASVSSGSDESTMFDEAMWGISTNGEFGLCYFAYLKENPKINNLVREKSNEIKIAAQHEFLTKDNNAKPTVNNEGRLYSVLRVSSEFSKCKKSISSIPDSKFY